jgi:hypothetical protein
MDSEDSVSIAIKFVELLNRRKLGELTKLMPPDHKLYPGGETVIAGREKARESLSSYVSEWPEFQIHISDIYSIENRVVFVARTTCSCEQTSRASEIRQRRIYIAKVEKGLVSEFRHLDDTDQVRHEFGVAPEKKITQ